MQYIYILVTCIDTFYKSKESSIILWVLSILFNKTEYIKICVVVLVHFTPALVYNMLLVL